MQSTGKSLAFINLIGQPDFTRHDDCPHFQSTSDRKKLLPNTHLFYWNFFRFTRGDNFLSISRNRNRNSDRAIEKTPKGLWKIKHYANINHVRIYPVVTAISVNGTPMDVKSLVFTS